MKKIFGLGYEFLNPNEKMAYEILYNTLVQHKTSCDISGIKRGVDIPKVMFAVLGDNPEIIYFNKTLFRTMTGFLVKQLSFVGCIPQSQIRKKEQQLEAAVNDAVWYIDKNARNDKEILQGISEFLQKNVVYDYDESVFELGRDVKAKFPDAHNAYGALVNHKAVCDGFSSAYAIIAKSLGFKCMLVKGQSAFENSGNVEHVWNIVEFENKFYHIDSTWDANTYAVSNQYSYTYFGLDDDEMLLDHDWDYHETPICNSYELSYYFSNGLVAQSESQIENIIKRELKKGKREVRIRISSGIIIGESKYWIDKLPLIMSNAGVYEAYQYIWNEYARCLIIYLN